MEPREEQATACPVCRAGPGTGCVDGDGRPLVGPGNTSHARRHDAHRRSSRLDPAADRPVDDAGGDPIPTSYLIEIFEAGGERHCLWLEWREWTTRQRRWWCDCGRHGAWRIATEVEVERESEDHFRQVEASLRPPCMMSTVVSPFTRYSRVLDGAGRHP